MSHAEKICKQFVAIVRKIIQKRKLFLRFHSTLFARPSLFVSVVETYLVIVSDTFQVFTHIWAID